MNNYFEKKINRQQSMKWNHDIIMSKKDLKDWIKYETKHYSQITIIGKIFPITEYDAILKYQKRLRKTEYYLNTRKICRYLISYVILNRKSFIYGMKIRLNSCGKGLRIIHMGSIITNGDIGENASLFVNSAVVPNGNQYPNIGNGVKLYTNAVVCGGVTIGNNIVVGANSVVTKNFLEEGIVIAGVPAKRIK